MWHPATYLQYGGERGRPFGDLLVRVRASAPAEVVDLGCGPGTLTVGLTARWPRAHIRGLDSSPEMIDAARALDSQVSFAVADAQDWHPGSEVGVLLANAVLQWIPGHPALLQRWAGELSPGAVIAIQVPGNFDAPSHRSLRAVAAGPRWRDRLPDLRDLTAVLTPVEYAALLTRAGCTVDVWETTYLHLLPAGPAYREHPVLSWLEGTALRPVRAALDDGDWAEFRAELGARLVADYPVDGDVVPFPFRRIFAVAQVR